jgi:neutral trehalase
VAEALGNYSKENVLKSSSSKSLATKRHELIQGYLQSVETQFILTGKFWEKYNLHFGTLDVTNEYAMPDFFGWTAGVYMEYRTEFIGP